MKLLIALLLSILAFFSGCGLFGSKKEEIVIPPPPQLSQNVVKPIKREPGSLWGDDSRWNEIYTFTPSRKVGDVVLIQITESLKFRIDQSLKSKDPKLAKRDEQLAQGPAKPNDPDSADAKPEFNEGVSAPKKTGSAQKNDTAEIEGTILEIPSKGVYRIYANKPIAMGPLNPYVIVDGHIRERDISASDGVSSESIFNLRVDAVNLKAGSTLKTADGKVTEIPEAK